MEEERSTRADLKKRSTDWTDCACNVSYLSPSDVWADQLTSMMRARARIAFGR